MLQGSRRQRFLEREIREANLLCNLGRNQKDLDHCGATGGGLDALGDDFGEKAFGATLLTFSLIWSDKLSILIVISYCFNKSTNLSLKGCNSSFSLCIYLITIL